jgi:hypothetical protein
VVAAEDERITEMSVRDLESTLVTELESKVYASRQTLLFLALPKENQDRERSRAEQKAARESFVQFDKIPPDQFSDGKELFRWSTRPIYDVDGLLLFRDHTLTLGGGEE